MMVKIPDNGDNHDGQDAGMTGLAYGYSESCQSSDPLSIGCNAHARTSIGPIAVQ